MIQLDKFGYVVKNFISTVKSPSPGVDCHSNKYINLFNVTNEDCGEFNIQEFLDILGVYHDKKICSIVTYKDMEIATIVEFKKKGMFLARTKNWNKSYCYFISKSEKHVNYMANMLTYYVENSNSNSKLFHVKMGLGLGYSKPAVLNFLKRNYS